MRLLPIALLLASCAPSVAGTYSVTERVISGSCPESREPTTWTITEQADGYLIEYPGISGGCTVRADGSRLYGKCEFSAAGLQGRASVQYALEVTGDGLSGTTASYVPPGLATLPGGCRGETRITGTRL
jgi:hypothetical protein